MRLSASTASTARCLHQTPASCARAVPRRCRPGQNVWQRHVCRTVQPRSRQITTGAWFGNLLGGSSQGEQPSLSEAAAAAEAAQQALITNPNSPLAPYLQDRPHLADLCRTYGRLQQLYHRQLQQQLSNSLGQQSFEQLSQRVGIRPGAPTTVRDYIKIVPLEAVLWWKLQLGMDFGDIIRVRLGATDITDVTDTFIDLAQKVTDGLNGLLRDGTLPDQLSALVLPDLATLVTKGSVGAGSVLDERGQAQPVAPADKAAAQQLLLQALVTLGLPAGQAPQLADHPEQLPLLPGNEAQARHACAVLTHAQRLHLPVLFAMQSIIQNGTPEEQQQLADLHLEMMQLVSVLHINPLRDAPHELLASGWSAPITFVQLVAASWATNTMVAETWQQVQGAKAARDWSCSKLVMSGLEVLLKDSPLQPWVAVNSRLLFKTLPLCDDDEAYTDADVFSSSSLSMNWAQAATFTFATAADTHLTIKRALAGALQQLEEIGWDEAQVAKAREGAEADQRSLCLKDMPGCQDKVAKIYLQAWNSLMAIQGAGSEVLSRTRGLAPYLVYWQELALLAAQRGSGTPAALQLAQQLMQERQAVFVYRSAMQVAGVCMASDAAHYDWMQSDEWRLPPLTRTSADAAARAAAQAAKRSTQNMPAAAEGRVGSVNAALRKILQRLASPDYDGKEGTRAIIQALCTSQPAGLAEAAARLHAAVPGSSDYKGLHSHMWYLYAMAQHLLQETVLAPEVQPVLLGTGALPDVTIRACVQVRAALQQQHEHLLAAYHKLSPVFMGISARNVLYSCSVRSAACDKAGPAGSTTNLQSLEAARLSSILCVMGRLSMAQYLFLSSTANMLLQLTCCSNSMADSKQVVEAGAVSVLAAIEPSLGHLVLSSLSLPLQQPTQHSATAQRLLQAAALYVLRSRWLVPADKQEEGLRLQQAAQLLRRWSIGSGLAGYRIVANMLEVPDAMGARRVLSSPLVDVDPYKAAAAQEFWQQLMLVGVRAQPLLIYGRQQFGGTTASSGGKLSRLADFDTVQKGSTAEAGLAEIATGGLTIFEGLSLSEKDVESSELTPYKSIVLMGEGLPSRLALLELQLAAACGFKFHVRSLSAKVLSAMIKRFIVPLAGAQEYHQQALQLADLMDQCLTAQARAVVSPDWGSVWAEAAMEAARRGVLLEGVGPLQLVQAPPPHIAEEQLQPLLWHTLETLATTPAAAAEAATDPQASSGAWESDAPPVGPQWTATAAAVAVVQLGAAAPQRPLAVQQAVLSSLVDHWVHAERVVPPEGYVVRQQQMLALLQQLQQHSVLLLTPQAMRQLLHPWLKLSPDQLVVPGASLAWVDGMLLAAAQRGWLEVVIPCLAMASAKGWLGQLVSAAEAAEELNMRLYNQSQDASARLDAWAAMAVMGGVLHPQSVATVLSDLQPAAAAASGQEASSKGENALWQQLQQRLQDIQQWAGPAAAAHAIEGLIEAAAGAELAVGLFGQLQQVRQKTGSAAACVAGLRAEARGRLLELVGAAAGSGAMSTCNATIILQALQLTDPARDESSPAAAAAAATGAAADIRNNDLGTQPSVTRVAQLSPSAQVAAVRAYAALGLDSAVVELVAVTDGQLLAPAVAAWHARVFQQDTRTSKEVLLTLQPYDSDTPAPLTTTPSKHLLQTMVDPVLQKGGAGSVLQLLQLLACSAGTQQPGVQAAMGYLTQQQAAAAAVQLLKEEQYVEAAEQLVQGYVAEGHPLTTGLLVAYAAAAGVGGVGIGNKSPIAAVAAQRVLTVLSGLQVPVVAEALQVALGSSSSNPGSAAAVPVLEALLAAVSTGSAAGAAAAAGGPADAASMSPELLVSLVTYKCAAGAAQDVEGAAQLLEGWLEAGKNAPAPGTAAFVAAVAAGTDASSKCGQAQLQARLLTAAAGAGQLVEVLTCLLSQQAPGPAVAAALTQLAAGDTATTQQQQEQLALLLPQLHAVVEQQCQAGAWQVVQQLLSSFMQLGVQLPATAAAAYLNHLASSQPAAAPASAAAVLHFLGASSNDGGAAAAPEAQHSAAVTLQLSDVASYMIKLEPEWTTSWEQQLQPFTAAAVLFSCWAWAQPEEPGQVVALYNSIRQLQGVRELLLPQLVCEVALAAAGQAGDWGAAEAIINAAQKQHQQEAASSSSGGAKKQRAGSPSEPWAPALPAALAAWAALQVHIPANSQEGVQKGKQLLLDACLQVRAQQQPSSGADSAAAAAAGRKKKGAGAATAAPTKEVDSPAGGLPLLQPAVVNAVLLAMLQRGAGDPSAAREAAAAAVVVLEQLLGCSIPNAAAGNPLTPAAPGCLPDVHTWALTVRLWGAAQPFSTSTVPSLSPAALLAAAFSRKLPVAGGSSSWDAAAVQELAAAGVAALRAAGRHEEGLQLLRVLGEGGVVELSSGLLALEVVQLLEAPGSTADPDQLLEMLADEEEDYFKVEVAAEAAQADLAAAATRLSSTSSSGTGDSLDQGTGMAAYTLLLQHHQQRSRMLQQVGDTQGEGVGLAGSGTANKLAARAFRQPLMAASNSPAVQLKVPALAQ